MADWYVSSANYAALPQWAANTPYTVGQLIRSLATPGQVYSYVVQRCTTAGTSGASEPGWSIGNNQGTGSGTATFTCVSGQPAYGWAGAAGNIYTMSFAGSPKAAAGDRIFVASDHVESHSGSWSFGFGNTTGVIQIISVNRVGAIPPGAADIKPGATINGTGSVVTFDAMTVTYWQGIVFNHAATTIYHNSGQYKVSHFKDCTFVFSANATVLITSNNPAKVIWENSTLQIANAGVSIRAAGYAFELHWLNTPNAIRGGVIPTTLFFAGSSGMSALVLRGVDLSAITTRLVSGSNGGVKALFDGCKIAPTVVRLYTTSSNMVSDEVEMVNCHDGSSVVNERHTEAGDLTYDRSTVLSGGASDNNGSFCFRMASNPNSDRSILMLDSFWLDVENAVVGVPRTATVEIVSSATQNNNDIRLSLYYPGTGGSSFATLIDSQPSVISSLPLPVSSSIWTNPPATPVKQLLQVTFTPQLPGRIRARVSLGKPNTIVWVNPQLVLS